MGHENDKLIDELCVFSYSANDTGISLTFAPINNGMTANWQQWNGLTLVDMHSFVKLKAQM